MRTSSHKLFERVHTKILHSFSVSFARISILLERICSTSEPSSVESPSRSVVPACREFSSRSRARKDFVTEERSTRTDRIVGGAGLWALFARAWTLVFALPPRRTADPRKEAKRGEPDRSLDPEVQTVSYSSGSRNSSLVELDKFAPRNVSREPSVYANPIVFSFR